MQMAITFDSSSEARDPRAVAILAKTIYRELRASGFERFAVMLRLSSMEAAGDHLGGNQALAIKDGLHSITPWLILA